MLEVRRIRTVGISEDGEDAVEAMRVRTARKQARSTTWLGGWELIAALIQTILFYSSTRGHGLNIGVIPFPPRIKLRQIS